MIRHRIWDSDGYRESRRENDVIGARVAIVSVLFKLFVYVEKIKETIVQNYFLQKENNGKIRK